MIFKWFKSKPAKIPTLSDVLLEKSDEDYLTSLYEMFESAPDRDAFLAMILVAVDNFGPLHDFALKHPETKISNCSDHMTVLFRHYEEAQADEIKSRRLFWFWGAAALGHAFEIVNARPALMPELAEIWVMLVKAAPHLLSLLPNNIVWEDREKERYRGIKTERDFTRHAIVWSMPSSVRNSARIRTLTKELNDDWLNMYLSRLKE